MCFTGLFFISISEGDGQKKQTKTKKKQNVTTFFFFFHEGFKKYINSFEIGGHVSGAPSVSTIGMFSVAPSCQP